jgi:hypothetical protein
MKLRCSGRSMFAVRICSNGKTKNDQQKALLRLSWRPWQPGNAYSGWNAALYWHRRFKKELMKIPTAIVSPINSN